MRQNDNHFLCTQNNVFLRVKKKPIGNKLYLMPSGGKRESYNS